MSSSKLNLNLLGETVNIDPPSDLTELKEKISEKYVLKKSDTDELILSYIKDSKNINIQSEDDYKAFLESKINQIKIEINQNSNLNQENITKLREEKINDEKKLNELLKQNDEYKKLLSTKFITQKQEIIEISKQIQELFSKRKKLIQYIKIEKGKIMKSKKNNDKAIIELQKKLGLKANTKIKTESENDTNSIINNKKKLRKFRKFSKKTETIFHKHNKFYRTLSKENRKNSNSPSPKMPMEISLRNEKNKIYNKINFNINAKRKASPMSGHDISSKERKIININDSKNNLNPFNEEKEKEEVKAQKQKFVKIAEIICNTIKSKNDVTNDKKVPIAQDKKLKNKTNKNENKMEENNEIKKNVEKKNEFVNNLINKHQKYEHLLVANKEKSKNSSVKLNDEKKSENKKINVKSNAIKKDSSLKNNKK
jgi:hypothetical protein